MSKLAPFKLILGVDQTGASADGGRRAKPLPCAIVSLREEKWHLEVFDSDGRPLTLPSFNRDSIEPLVIARGYNLGNAALAVDCVMGLSDKAWPSCKGGSAPLWNLFAQAARDLPERVGYGLKPAARFFDEIRAAAKIADKPARKCELLAKANSVFNTHPFQKNVQCGTYRIWRDLGAEALPPHKRWLRLWNFDEVLQDENQAWFFESYPSLLWREVLNLNTRKISDLRTRIEAVFESQIEIDPGAWELLEVDPNHADSAVLALGTWFLQSKSDLFMTKNLPREKWLTREGWISGLKFQN